MEFIIIILTIIVFIGVIALVCKIFSSGKIKRSKVSFKLCKVFDVNIESEYK